MRTKIVLAAALASSLLAAGAARAAELIANGDFATGDFTGWTLFTTANGSLGFPPDPQVTSFDVTGSGAQNAAEFQAGFVGNSFVQEGGGIRQTFDTGGGLFSFHADFAAFNDFDLNNATAGEFSAILDGVAYDTVHLGPVAPDATDRGALDFTTTLSPGPHTIELLVTRNFSTGDFRGNTPFQYLTNISGTGAAVGLVPEPALWTMLLAGFAGLGAVLRHRRRPAQPSP